MLRTAPVRRWGWHCSVFLMSNQVDEDFANLLINPWSFVCKLETANVGERAIRTFKTQSASARMSGRTIRRPHAAIKGVAQR